MNYSANEPEPQVTLTLSGKKWAAVLTNLSVAFPTSKLHEMGKAEIQETAAVWDHALKSVPEFAIFELYERLIAKWVKPFPPMFGDFRQEFGEWVDGGFWEQHNGEAEYRDDADIFALPSGVYQGPGYQTAQIQMARFKANLPPVQCQCRNEYDNLEAAILNDACDTWICQHRQKGPIYDTGPGCNFSLPLADTDKFRATPSGQLSEQELRSRLNDLGFPIALISDRERLIEFGRFAAATLKPLHWNHNIVQALWLQFKRLHPKPKAEEKESQAAAV